MLLNPNIDDSELEIPVDNGILSVLAKSGVEGVQDPAEAVEEGKNNFKDIQAVFKDHGASLKDCAYTIGEVMASSKYAGDKLRAAHLALRLQGYETVPEKKKEQFAPPVVNVTIVASQEGKALVNLIMP